MRWVSCFPGGCRELPGCAKRPECCSSSRGSRTKSTPLPKLKVMVAGVVLLNNHFGTILLFPFLPFMVQDFFPELTKEELGKKTGYLGSIYYLGSFAGSLLWGCLADRWGRRPVIMLGICGSIFSEILFGFSQNFTWALSARFLWGMLNGNLGVTKTYISEVCDNSNLAKGFAVVGASGGIGRLIGATLGGFLAQPASKYTPFENPFFCQFPYLLPCLSAAGIALISLIATCLFMEETLHKGRFSHPSAQQNGHCRSPTNENAVADPLSGDDTTDVEMVSLSSDGMSSGTEELTNRIFESDVDLESDNTGISDSDADPLLGMEDVNVSCRRPGRAKAKKLIRMSTLVNCMKKFIYHQRRQWLECFWCCSPVGQCHTHRQASPISCRNCPRLMLRIIFYVLRGVKRILKLLCDRRVFLSIILYGIFGTLSNASQDLFPLLFVNDHAHGGYHLDDNEIGVLAMTAAVCEFLFQSFLYFIIARLLGFRCVFRLGVLVFLVGCIIVPFSNTITGPIAFNGTTDALTSGSGMWAGPGFNSVDYCGQDTSDSQANVNENSIARIPLPIWVMAAVALLFFVMPNLLGVCSLTVMIGNSSLTETRGTINGVSQSLVALLRFITPTLASLGLAWSEENTDKGYSWPLNYHFVFDVFALLGLLTLFISLFLPKSIETKRQA